MVHDKVDIKFQVCRKGTVKHYDFRKSTSGFRGSDDGEEYRTVTEIDEKFESRLNKKAAGLGTQLRDKAIAFFNNVGDDLNAILFDVRFLGGYLQVRKYDE